VKALSVRQPWAWAIFHAGKDIENRSQYRHYRGDLVIHAPATVATADEWPRGVSRPDADTLPCRAILGVVEVVDVVSRNSSPWFLGPFGFVLANPRALPQPIPNVKGNASFWTVPPAVADAIRRQLGRSPIDGHEMALTSRLLTVTQGNLRNRHLYLREAFDIFPENVFGGADASQSAPQTIRVQWGSEMVETDIDRAKKIFRKRGWVGQFFDEARIQAGDRVLLEQLEPYTYRLSKAP
jgi:hypothetical protein